MINTDPKNQEQLQFSDSVSEKDFRKIADGFKRHFALPIEATESDGINIQKMCEDGCHPAFCKMIRSSRTGINRCKQDRIRSLKLAFETGQPYTSFCHAGIVLVCVPVMESDIPLGGLFFGKCLSEPPTKPIEDDIFKRLKGLRFDKEKMRQAIADLPIVPARKIHQASEFLFILLYETADLDPRVIQWRRQRYLQQSEISDYIHETKKTAEHIPYPYESEQELIAKVKIGDRIGAKEILNNLLGAIMFRNPGDNNVLKARLTELLSILSRAAAEGGVDINVLLEKNLNYITKVMSIDSQDELCAWISSALNDFIECVYLMQDSKKITQIKPAVDFIEENYEKPITLSMIAKATHLSVSRLAHLFKEQMGITLIDYLTNVRINHAKRLLISTDKNCTSVCFDVGYNNQSYFTRTFKQLVGMTPRQYRLSNNRPGSID